MAMNPLIVILAYGGAQPIFDRHMPLWKRHGVPILVACPHTALVETTENRWLTGPDGYCCAHTVTRWRWLLRNLVAHTKHSHYVFFEYDSFYLGRELPTESGFRGTIAPNVDGAFLGETYPCPPWSMDSETLKRILPMAFCDTTENGVDDRMLGAWCLMAGIPMANFTDSGYIMNTILPEHYPEMERAVTVDKAKWIHGVKDAGCLDFIKAKGWLE